jgi:predicted DCC family thiol-disulfide oxidoreductase YuxK
MKVVFFDGVCNLCNYSVRFLRKHDKNNVFQIHSLQSELAAKLLSPHFPQQLPDSIVYLNDQQVFVQSNAVLMILKELPLPYKLLYAFKLVPKGLRDSVYRYIAKNRYRWFGKCPLEGL